MLQMQAPYYFEHKRKLRTNKLTLQDQLKESQLASHQLLSEDLLIRSQREAQTNIVPFILQMGQAVPPGQSSLIRQLALALNDEFIFTSRRGKFAGNFQS